MRESDDAGYLPTPPHEVRNAIDALVREGPESITLHRDLVIRRCARAMAAMRPPSNFH